jgi:uncharacterized protein (DUF1330 family)
MCVYLIGQIKIKDQDLWQQYVAGVQESLTPHNARILFRGRRIEVLAGNHDKDLVVVIEFADQVTLDSWFSSESYQTLIPLRDQAADVVITSYRA